MPALRPRRLFPVALSVVALRVALLLGPAVGAATPTAVAGPASPDVVTVSLVGTSDLHGALLPREGKGGLALFAGYVRNLRRARAADGGAVLLLDAGDMFQGTLESNLNEGAAVIRAYNAIGYDAAAIGNHEFDYGPVGPAATAGPGEDPLGALRARASESRFPLLAANLIERGTGKPLALPNVAPARLVEKAGVRIGVVGVTTESTLKNTMAANVRGLAVTPLAAAIAKRAAELRRARAVVVVVAAHAGGRCSDFADPRDVSSCDGDEEIMRAARSLPSGAVDVIVAGHTHEAMAHFVSGIAIIESYSGGRAFGRVDLEVNRRAGRVVRVVVDRPHDVAPGSYEGAPVAPDAMVESLLAPDVERARERKQAKLGIVLAETFQREQARESPVGNLVTDWMRAAWPVALDDHGDPLAAVAIIQSGGLRADLPAGELTYGALYETLPFDNRFAAVEMTGRDLRRIIADNLQGNGGLLSVSGVRVVARCTGATLAVTTDPPVRDDERVVVLMSDFLATGGGDLPLPVGVRVENGPPMRDEIARALGAHDGQPALHVASVMDPERPRIDFPGKRPVRCEAR